MGYLWVCIISQNYRIDFVTVNHELKIFMHKFGILLFGICLRASFADDVAAKSAEYASEYCAKVTEKLTYSHMDDTMIEQFVLSPNYLQQVVYDTTCPDIWTCLENYRSELTRTAIRAGFAVVLAVVTLIAYILMAPCGCCRCCRTCRGWCCCRQTRKVGYNMKRDMILFIWMTTIMLLAGVVIDVIFSARFLQDLNDGGEAALCETFSLASDVLNGNNGNYTDPVTGQLETHAFIGSTQAQSDVETILTAIQSPSTLTTSIDSALAQTTNLNATIVELYAWLAFTKEELGSSITVSDHTCLLCKACCDSSTGGAYIDQLLNVSIVQSYAASVLLLRTVVDTYFSTTGVETLSTALINANDTLYQFTDTFENDIVVYLVDQKSTFDLVLELSKWLSIGIVIAIVVPLLVFGTSVAYAIFRSDRPSYTDPKIKPMEPWCSWCGWSMWFLYGFLILLVAGALGILGYAEGASCEMMNNMDDFVNKTYWRLQNSSDTLQSDSIESVVNECAISTGSGLLLQGVNVTTDVTASDVLIASVAIIEQFDVVYANTSVSKNFVDDPVFSRLIFAMKNYGNMYMMMADEIASRTSSSDNQTVSQAGFGGVAACNGMTDLLVNGTIGEWIIDSINTAGGNETIPVSGESTSVTLPGASDFYTALSSASISIGTTSSTCPSGLSAAVPTQSPPWGQLMSDKMDVVTKTNYQCGSFSFSWDSTTGTPSYSTSAATCSYAAFGTYINNLATTLVAKATAMDTAAAAAAAVLDTDVREPLNTQVVPYLEELAYGLDCQFINARLLAFYDSLCWAHTPGVIGLCFALFGFGLISWFGIAAQFVVWRHLRGNKDAWKDATKGRRASQVEMVPVDPKYVSDTYASGGPNNGASSNLSSRPRDPGSVVSASAGNANVVVVQ